MRFLVVIVLLTIATGCDRLGSDGGTQSPFTLVPQSPATAVAEYPIAANEPVSPTPAPVIARLTKAQIANATYPVGEANRHAVTLNNGVFQGEFGDDGAIPTTIVLDERTAFGDLDGDGVEDAAVILVTHAGGTGVFYRLYAVFNQAGEAAPMAGEMLGDRVKIEAIRIDEGEIVVDMVVHAAADPFCCPTEALTTRYRMPVGLGQTEELVAAKPAGLLLAKVRFDTGALATNLSLSLKEMFGLPVRDEIDPDKPSNYLRLAFDNEPLSQVFRAQERQLIIVTTEYYEAQNHPINLLADLLQTRPLFVEGELPLLPRVPALQLFHAQQQYLSFQNGTGVRFLTQYAPQPSPIYNEDLFYTFQGMTSDGDYVVSFFYPVSTFLLQDSYGQAVAGFNAGSHTQYKQQMVHNINSFRPDQFSPSLSELDAMAASLEIGD